MNKSYKMYKHLLYTGVFGIAEKLKEYRKNDRKKRFKK